MNNYQPTMYLSYEQTLIADNSSIMAIHLDGKLLRAGTCFTM